jgi:RNA polymerase sigma-70 factor (ECF subfamily)
MGADDSAEGYQKTMSGTSMARAILAPTPGSRGSQEVAACRPDLAFEQMVERFRLDLMRFALHLTGNRSDADDLFQETMLKAQRAFDRLPADAAHRPWLLRIATNTFLDDRRRRSRLTHLAPAHEAALVAPTHDVVDTLDARDLLVDVWAAIGCLPRKQRVALTLRKQGEASYDEIGLALDMTPTAARANVYQALRKLREQFGDRL